MRIKIIFGLLGLLAVLGFLSHAWVVGSAVWGDGRFYYQYLPSLVINGNLGSPNKYAIGPAIFWLPFFIIAHLIIHGNGYEFPYQLVVGLTSVLFGLLGLFLCFLSAKRYFGEKIALIAALAIWFSSNLFFYTVLDPINSHAISFFVASLTVYLWVLGPPTPRLWRARRLWILGLLVGILGMVRSQDLIFALPLLFWVRKPKKILLLAGGILLGFLPQLIVWKIQSGQITSPYLLAGEKFIWLKLQIMAVLFSRNNGLFYYSPILILGLLGLPALRCEARRAGLLGILLFVMQTYIVSAWHSWSGGQAYGGRMFISLMPFFILGLAGILEKLKKIKLLSYITLSILVIINFYSIAKFLITSP